MNFGIGASYWLDVIAWAQHVAAPALFWFSAGLVTGRLTMNAFLMLAGTAVTVVGLCMFAVGWGVLPS
jgi:hypothetical protein